MLKKRTGQKKKKMFIGAILLVIVVIYLVWGNTALQTTVIEIVDEEIPAGLQGFTLVQISDLHNTEFGQRQEKLLAEMTAAQPDIIVVTGDLLDSYAPDPDIALDFIRQAVAIAPVYYVAGNHEARLPEQYGALSQQMEAVGAVVLAEKRIALQQNGDIIYLLGVNDPSFTKTDAEQTVMATALAELTAGIDGYTILLSHRPELFSVYCEAGIDLTLSGHAHGGQIRLPGVGGLFAPNQGWLPQYTAGLYQRDGSKMVVSRGLGNSIFPLRVNNRPEMVVITLNNQV